MTQVGHRVDTRCSNGSSHRMATPGVGQHGLGVSQVQQLEAAGACCGPNSADEPQQCMQAHWMMITSVMWCMELVKRAPYLPACKGDSL
jgi:hypothetical protein